jgi:hypothetical protein
VASELQKATPCDERHRPSCQKMAIRVERRRPEKDGGDMSEHRGVRAVAIAAAKGVSTAANVSKSDATAERSTNREEMIREAAILPRGATGVRCGG